MKNSKFCCYLLFCLLLLSCRKHYTNNETILHAKTLLYSKPDSAQKLLLSVPQPGTLPKADYAAWCLLYTHSQYKLYQNIKSDSLIRVAVNYYEGGNLPVEEGTAYYLLGCILQSEAKNKEAMLALKKAKDLLAKTKEADLTGLVNFEIGCIYSNDEVFKQALIAHKKALNYFIRSKNQKYQAYAYRAISDLYVRLHESLDSFMLYSDIALKSSIQVGDSGNYYSVLAQQGEILYDRNPLRSKECLLRGYHFFPNKQSYYAAYLSYIYSKLNKQDSAKYYLKVAFTGVADRNEMGLKYLAAAYVNKYQGNPSQAFHYLEKAYENRDSTFEESIRSQVYRIDKQYDLTQKEKENAELKISRRNGIIVIALLIIGILILSIIALLANNRYKRKQAEHAIEKQRMQYEIEAKHTENIQKRQLLLAKLQNKIENTLRFNQLRTGLLQQDKQAAFMDEITKQAIISEKEWQYYIDEINHLFDGRISHLLEEYAGLTQADLMVIALICLQKDVADCCSLLNMTQNTMYTRRKRIKKRISLDTDVDLEKWLLEYMQLKPNDEEPE